MSNTLRIGDGEDCDYMVCILLTKPLRFPDNLIDQCCRCRRMIQHRPHAPKRPKKVCYECIAPDIQRDGAKGELDSVMTPKTAAEISEYMRRKSRH